MKIQTKFLSGYAASSVLIVGLGALILYTIHRSSPIANELDGQVEALGQAVSLSGLTGQIASLRAELSYSTNRFMHTPDPAHEREYDRASRHLVEVFDEALKKSETEDDAIIFRNLREASQKLEKTEREMMALAKANSLEEAQAMSQADPYLELNEAISKFIAIFANRKQTDSHDEFSRLIEISATIRTNRENVVTLTTIAWVSVLLIFGSSILIGILTARMIVQPLSVLAEGAARIGEGSLDHRIGIKRNDEIGVLSDALDDMAEKLSMIREKALQRNAALAHSARLITLGEMTAGIAHELNQPLAAIVSRAEACTIRLRSPDTDGDRIQQNLQEVVAQAERAGKIIRRLRNLARRRVSVRSTVDLNELVREAASLTASEMTLCGVRIQLELCESLESISADSIQIEQVVLNLLRNAIDVLGSVDDHERIVTITTLSSADRSVEVSVHDTGPGISAEDFGRVFDPFFTTKSEGIGIGLAISQSIIKAHDGRLWLDPAVERGTTFRFRIPLDAGVSHDC